MGEYLRTSSLRAGREGRRERREVAAGPAREEGEKSRRETRLYLQEMVFVEEKEQERFGSSDVLGAYLAH